MLPLVELGFLYDYTTPFRFDAAIIINKMQLLSPLEMLIVFSIIEFYLQWYRERQTVLKL